MIAASVAVPAVATYGSRSRQSCQPGVSSRHLQKLLPGWGRADRAAVAERAGDAHSRAESSRAASSRCRAVRVLASAPPNEAQRERSAQVISQTAPFVTDPTVVSERITLTGPTDFEYLGQRALAQETQGGTVFKSQLDREAYAALATAYKQRAASELPGGLKVQVLRAFRADTNTVLVRWKGTWRAGGAAVEGNSTYKLGEDGLLSEHSDQFQVLPRKDKETAAFMDIFEFALTRRPAGYPAQFRRSFVPAVRLAAWEALKNEEEFGGQLIRSEMDVLTDQFLIALTALGVSTFYLIAKIVSRVTGGPL